MYRQEQLKNLLKAVLSFINWSVMTLLWAMFWMTNYADDILRPFGYKGNWLVIAVYAVLLFLFTNFYGGYRIGYYRTGDVMLSCILAMVITNGVTWLQTCLIGRAIMSIEPFISMSILQGFLLIIWSIVANWLYIKCFPPHKMLLIYGGRQMAESLIGKMVSRSEKFQIDEAIHIEKGMEAVQERLENYQTAILCDLPPKQRNQLLKYCFAHSIRTYTTPKLSDILIRSAGNVKLFDTPLLINRNEGLNMQQRFAKRTMDLVVSGLMLLVASPIMLLTALAIKLYDRGPVFFYQRRCTKDNREFDVIKFRSMIVNAEKDGKPRPATDGDPRITPVGRFIRATRLDELPQLFNVFKGEMSLVGPRPERIEHVLAYTDEIPEFVLRTKVKAGLTGYAQVVGRYNTTAYDKLKMDLMYIANYSVLEDIKLLMMTVKIVFVRESTEGFESKKK